MTAGTAIMIIGRGITDKGLDDGRDLTSLYPFAARPMISAHGTGPLFCLWSVARYFSRNILFSSFDLPKYSQMAAPTQSNHQLTAI